MIKFNDWMQAKEATAFTRWRHEAALGLKPPISPAAVNSHSTASPFEVKKLSGKKKKKKKKKISENHRPEPTLHKDIDIWLVQVEKLKKTFEDLKKNLNKKKSKPDNDKSDEPTKDHPKDEKSKKDEPANVEKDSQEDKDKKEDLKKGNLKRNNE